MFQLKHLCKHQFLHHQGKHQWGGVRGAWLTDWMRCRSLSSFSSSFDEEDGEEKSAHQRMRGAMPQIRQRVRAHYMHLQRVINSVEGAKGKTRLYFAFGPRNSTLMNCSGRFWLDCDGWTPRGGSRIQRSCKFVFLRLSPLQVWHYPLLLLCTFLQFSLEAWNPLFQMVRMRLVRLHLCGIFEWQFVFWSDWKRGITITNHSVINPANIR